MVTAIGILMRLLMGQVMLQTQTLNQQTLIMMDFLMHLKITLGLTLTIRIWMKQCTTLSAHFFSQWLLDQTCIFMILQYQKMLF